MKYKMDINKYLQECIYNTQSKLFEETLSQANSLDDLVFRDDLL